MKANIFGVALFAAFVVLLLSPNPICRDANFNAGPMVQIGNTDGKSSIVIVWHTQNISDGWLKCGDRIVKSSPGRRHEAVLTGLEPNAVYNYRVVSNGRVFAESHFFTAKTADWPIRFAVFGDSGSGKPDQYAVARAVQDSGADFILHTGDLVYGGERREFFPNFYAPYRDFIRSKLFFPVLGNHDYADTDGAAFLENFVLPGNERYYSFDYGAAHFTALDSNRVDSESANWLDRDLASSDSRWKIVFFHQPPFSNKLGRDDDKAIIARWTPIFEERKVDVVFCGHDHLYARFQPVNGVHYIVEGLGGKSRYKTRPDQRVVSTHNEEYGFGLATISGNRLAFEHRTASGKVIDKFSLEK